MFPEKYEQTISHEITCAFWLFKNGKTLFTKFK